MFRISMTLSLVLGIGANCMAQNRLVIRGVTNQGQKAEAEKIYSSACLAVEREFRIIDSVRPKVTLIVGVHENRAYTESKEIRLINWDPELFAQGVVVIAFNELLPKASENRWRNVPSLGRARSWTLELSQNSSGDHANRATSEWIKGRLNLQIVWRNPQSRVTQNRTSSKLLKMPTVPCTRYAGPTKSRSLN